MKSNLKFLADRQSLIILVLFLFMFLERLLFQRSLYADGSCYFIWDYLSESGKFHNYDRALALMLNHIPFHILKIFNINDYHINFYFYKIGFVFPFLVSFILSKMLQDQYRIHFNSFFLISIIFFYLPNSMFAVGEYNVIYAFLPLLVVSLKELYEKNSNGASTCILISALILIFSYSLATIYVILFTMIFLIKKSINSNTDEKLNLFKSSNLLIFCLLALSLVFLIYQNIFMSPVIKRNGIWGVTDYLTRPKTGGFSDSWFYFILFFSLSLKYLSNYYTNLKNNFKKYFFSSCLIFFLILFLFTNHQPSHSYYSKILFILSIGLISLQYFFLSHQVMNNINNFLNNLFPIALLLVFIFIIQQGIGFNNHMDSLKNIIEDDNNYSNEIRIPNSRLNMFDWSWGHDCLSRIIFSNGKIIIKNDNINYGHKSTVRDNNFNLKEYLIK